MKVNIALLTVTDTRTLNTDKSGGILVEKIKKAKHNLFDRKICKDSKKEGFNYFQFMFSSLKIILNFILTTQRNFNKLKRSKVF